MLTITTNLFKHDKCFRWVYKHIFVADGNFKADHVRQKNSNGDIWLSEGSGMIPIREEYLAFLKTAIERLTVSNRVWPRLFFANAIGFVGICYS